MSIARQRPGRRQIIALQEDACGLCSIGDRERAAGSVPRKSCCRIGPVAETSEARASEPLNPSIFPVKAWTSSSISVPVVPANITSWALAPAISTVAPSVTVIEGAALTVDNDCAVVSTVADNAVSERRRRGAVRAVRIRSCRRQAVRSGRHGMSRQRMLGVRRYQLQSNHAADRLNSQRLAQQGFR